MRISVLGLGRMGAPMARHLIEVGHDVTLYNRTRERAMDVATKEPRVATSAKSARVAATVAEAVNETQVALTMVSNDEAEVALTFGVDGLLAHLPVGAIHLCMSTIGLETSRKLALAHADAGQGYVAAPVFGRPGMAVTGHLWIVAGGPDLQVTRCLTIFDALGRGVTRVGPRAELAHALKLGGNLLTAVVTEGLAEVLAYGEKAGMAPGEYLRLLNTAIFKSPMMDACGGLMVRHLHDPADLTLDAALQDLQSVLQASEELDAVMPMAELLQHRLELALVQGWGGQDLTVLSRSCRMGAGMEAGEAREEAENLQPDSRPSQFTAQSREGEVELELNKITHFEIIKDAVWAWTQGQRYRTPWKYLTEVEKTFRNIAFVSIHRHILLQPEAALARKAISGGTSKALGEEKREPAYLGLEEHLPTQPVEVEGKQVTPELVRTTHAEIEQEPAWARAQGKPAPTGWGNLVERSFGYISSLRLQRPTPEPPVETPLQRSVARETPLAIGEEKHHPSLFGQGAQRPNLPSKTDEKQAIPALEQTSHFEIENDAVWAWVQGRRIRTHWRNMAEVEAAFSQVILLKIQRNILLNPEAVLAIQPVFGGRAKVKVAGNMELDVSRTAALRLRELLGM